MVRYGLMRQQQWYWRRKPDADCYIGKKFEDTVEYEENCPCEDDDYEWCAPAITSARGLLTPA
jgi:hypothetical protein